jgi:hypothetical protein
MLEVAEGQIKWHLLELVVEQVRVELVELEP